ncbi:MAG TPA: sigma 54-dependent Fis family transcriptional regulator [Polyangia bacterium]|nr:sigma 54-dependent Fis family transcriptional regulator [Polyangia bacterium]
MTPEDPTKTGLLFTDHASGTLKARRYRISVVAGPDTGASSEIDNGTFLLGTHQNNDLRLTDKGVSRYHLELQLRAEGLKVTDLDSTNGTFQGPTRIGSITLNGAARLKLGTNTEVEINPADVPVQMSGFEGERFGQAIGGSRYMKDLFGLLDRVSNTEATVLLEGETGTGKELLAEAIHLRSSRKGGPFVVVDCGALPRDLIGSELFGHVRGAFTGALSAKRGLIEEADGGTLFLDEVGELPLDLQPQLLRALEKREVRPIGEVRAKKVNIRVVAATNKNLPELVRSGQFREDLYFRLAVVRAAVPALRKHKEDIPLLVRNFLRELKRDDFEIGPDVLSQLMAHDWPGNVRELRNVVERGLSLEGGALPIEVSGDVGTATNDAGNYNPGGMSKDVLEKPFKEAKGLLVESFEREYLTHLLQRHNGNISRAALEAGIDRNYIHRLVKKYGIPVDRT